MGKKLTLAMLCLCLCLAFLSASEGACIPQTVRVSKRHIAKHFKRAKHKNRHHAKKHRGRKAHASQGDVIKLQTKAVQYGVSMNALSGTIKHLSKGTQKSAKKV